MRFNFQPLRALQAMFFKHMSREILARVAATVGRTENYPPRR